MVSAVTVSVFVFFVHNVDTAVSFVVIFFLYFSVVVVVVTAVVVAYSIKKRVVGSTLRLVSNFSCGRCCCYGWSRLSLLLFLFFFSLLFVFLVLPLCTVALDAIAFVVFYQTFKNKIINTRVHRSLKR